MIPDFWIAIELETSSSEFKSNIFARSMTIELALYLAAQVGKHYYSFYLIAATMQIPGDHFLQNSGFTIHL